MFYRNSLIHFFFYIKAVKKLCIFLGLHFKGLSYKVYFRRGTLNKCIMFSNSFINLLSRLRRDPSTYRVLPRSPWQHDLHVDVFEHVGGGGGGELVRLPGALHRRLHAAAGRRRGRVGGVGGPRRHAVQPVHAAGTGVVRLLLLVAGQDDWRERERRRRRRGQSGY